VIPEGVESEGEKTPWGKILGSILLTGVQLASAAAKG